MYIIINIYTYIQYTHIYIYTYIHTHIYIEREREKGFDCLIQVELEKKVYIVVTTEPINKLTTHFAQTFSLLLKLFRC